MCTTEMVLLALFLKTSKFLPASVSIYILSLMVAHTYIFTLQIRYKRLLLDQLKLIYI